MSTRSDISFLAGQHRRVWCPTVLAVLFFFFLGGSVLLCHITLFSSFHMESLSLLFSSPDYLLCTRAATCQPWAVLYSQVQVISFPKRFHLFDFLGCRFCSLWDLSSLALTCVEYMTLQVVWIVNIRAGKGWRYDTRWGINICICLGIKTRVFNLTTSSPEVRYIAINRETLLFQGRFLNILDPSMIWPKKWPLFTAFFTWG